MPVCACLRPPLRQPGQEVFVCVSCANAACDGGSVSALMPAGPRPPTVAPVASPTPLDTRTLDSGPNETLRLRSTLLGKRAFSAQPCPAYPFLPVMPTNQSSPWDSQRLRGGRDGPTQLSDAKVPTPVSMSLSAPGCYGDPVPSDTSEPVLSRDWLDLGKDGRTVGQDLVLDHALEPVAPILFEEGSCGSVGWPELESARAVDAYRMTLLELAGGVFHDASGVDLRPSWTGLEAAQPPSCPVSPLSAPLPPSLPPPPASPVTEATVEPCSVPMDPSAAPCLDASSCVCSVPCSAAIGRGSAADHPQRMCVSPEPHSVCSVTTQISSIHLAKESLPHTGLPGTPCPPLEERSTVSLETTTVLDCGEEEELAGQLESPASGEDDDDDDANKDGSEASTLSGGSAVTLALSNVEELTAGEDFRAEKPALVPSLFPCTAPTLYFSTANERVEMLPPEQSRLLKWKMSSVTPNVVKHTLARSHFTLTKKSHDWLGCWGHHMKSVAFSALHEHQKLNHFPGSFQIGRKDRLWRNLSKMQSLFGRREFSFFPQSFVLPKDMRLLKKAWEEGRRLKWIIKPPASARGNGIQVIHRWSQLPRKKPLLVQKYLHKPFLIDGSKFDLRIYVYVSSYDPLRVYIFPDGLVRFASCKYSSSMKSLGNKFMHLTNYSVNKKNSEYQSNHDDQACQGHKWTVKALWQYLSQKGVSTTLVWEQIKDIVIKAIIAADPYVNYNIQAHVRSAYSCHELFGFDIMLDEHLKPWLLEVNISPSLHSASALDLSVKGQMVRDVLNLAGFVLPQSEAVDAAERTDASVCAELKEGPRLKPQLAPDEKCKRIHYESQRFADQEFLSSVLDVLTPADVRALVQAEDELGRRGEFERVFPSPVSSRYMRFFQKPRYLNILLSQWELRHRGNRGQGLDLLRELCQKGVHLTSASDPAHTWSLQSKAGQKFEPSVDSSLNQAAFSGDQGFPPEGSVIRGLRPL